MSSSMTPYTHHYLKAGECFKLKRPPRTVKNVSVSAYSGKRMLDAVKRLEDRQAELTECFGLELRWAYDIGDGKKDLSLLDARLVRDHSVKDTRGMRQLFLRPVVEPILLSFWDQFQAGKPLGPDWIKLAQLLTPLVPLRSGKISTNKYPNGSFTEFPDPDQIQGWASQLDDVFCSEIDPVTKGFIMHAVAVTCHPLEDGNGRLARAAFWAGLSQAGVRSPVLPIAPLVFQNPNWLASAHRRLSITDDWQEYCSAMGEFQVLFEAVDSVQKRSLVGDRP